MRRTGTLLLAVVCAAAPIAVQRKTTQRKPSRPPAKIVAPAGHVKQERPVPFAVGEALAYDVSWSSYLTAGEATLSVRQKKPSYDSVAYYIVAEGRPVSLLSKIYTVYYKADTLLDVYSLLPQRGSTYSEEGKRHRFKAALFDQRARRAKYEVRTSSVSQQHVSLAPLTQDALSALYVLRALRLKRGDRLSIPVFDSGRLYQVRITGGPIENVRSGIGTLPAQRVEMNIVNARSEPAARNVAVWFSNDRRQLPVQIKAELAIGSFQLRLREARGLLP